MSEKANKVLAIDALSSVKGELLANHFRMSMVLILYLIELANFHGFILSKAMSVTEDFHSKMGLMATGAILYSLGIAISIRNRFYPVYFKYVSTFIDIVIVSILLVLADGAKSPLLILLFLVIVVSSLRFNIDLVRFSTIVSIVAYIAIVLFQQRTRPELAVPFYQSLITLVAFSQTGYLLILLLKQTKNLVKTFLLTQDP